MIAGLGLYMSKLRLAAAALLVSGVLIADADARVVVHVSKSRQMMYVYVDVVLVREWPVSTARGGYSTPSGVFHPTGLDPYHRSSKYHNSPMPYSIFFRGGYAIHGSYEVSRLGRPASHGCIRLPLDYARHFYEAATEGTPVVVKE